jgi:hypothetical protein
LFTHSKTDVGGTPVVTSTPSAEAARNPCGLAASFLGKTKSGLENEWRRRAVKHDLRSKSVSTKVSEAELRVLESRAERAGLTLSEWLIVRGKRLHKLSRLGIDRD